MLSRIQPMGVDEGVFLDLCRENECVWRENESQWPCVSTVAKGMAVGDHTLRPSSRFCYVSVHAVVVFVRSLAMIILCVISVAGIIDVALLNKFNC